MSWANNQEKSCNKIICVSNLYNKFKMLSNEDITIYILKKIIEVYYEIDTLE